MAPNVVKRDDSYDPVEDYDPYGVPNESELSSETPQKCKKVCTTVCLPTTSTPFITAKSSDQTG